MRTSISPRKCQKLSTSHRSTSTCYVLRVVDVYVQTVPYAYQNKDRKCTRRRSSRRARGWLVPRRALVNSLGGEVQCGNIKFFSIRLAPHPDSCSACRAPPNLVTRYSTALSRKLETRNHLHQLHEATQDVFIHLLR